MRTRLCFHGLQGVALTLLAAALAVPAAAQTGAGPQARPAPAVQGTLTVGGGANDNTGSPNRVSEYSALRDGSLGRLAAQLWGTRGDLRFDATASLLGDSRDQAYAADIRYARWLKAHVTYDRFARRLDHDPLSYVDAASGIGGTFVVGHTDSDPSARYRTAHGRFDARVEVTPPRAPALRLFASHRVDTAEGLRQSLTTSHCATCHVVSYSRGVDDRTRELSGGARLLLRGLDVEYSYTDRRFDDRTAPLTHTYSSGVHPATLADVFLNRLQYDQRAGALPFDITPDSRKDTHLLRAHVALPGDASATGTFTRSAVTNQDTSVGYTYTGAAGRLVVPLGRSVVFRGGLRKYEIEADDVLVDIVELASPAGPTGGLTYAQAYPTFGDPDYVRHSATARTPTSASMDLTWTPLARTSLHAGYEWESIERTSFEVEKTTTNTITLRARARPWKGFESRTRVQHDWIDDPFMFERAAIPSVLQPFQSPNNVPFTGLQYYEMYDSRQADLTSFPTRNARFDQSFTWTLSPRVSMNAHYRFGASSNDELNFSTWSRTAHSPGAEIWFGAGGNWNLAAGYSLQRERLETMFSTLAFVG